MRILIALVLVTLIAGSCGEHNKQSPLIEITSFEFSPALTSSFKEYIAITEALAPTDSIGYGMFVENIGPDSSVYYFHTFYSLRQISFRSMIMGVGYVDSIPVVVSMRNKELAVNYDSVNSIYLDFVSEYYTLTKKSMMIIDHPTYRCVYYNEDSVISGPATFSPVVPKASN